MILSFQAGEYKDFVAKNSTRREGDFNGDDDFDSSDLIAAFQAGTYEQDAVAAILAERIQRHPRLL